MIILNNSIMGVLLECGALGLYILMSKANMSIQIKQITMIIAFAILITIFVHAVRKLTLKQLVFLAGVLSLGFTLCYQIIGFIIYPGLVKDLTPFSLQHLLATTLLFGILFGGHSLAFCIISISKRLITK